MGTKPDSWCYGIAMVSCGRNSVTRWQGIATNGALHDVYSLRGRSPCQAVPSLPTTKVVDVATPSAHSTGKEQSTH
jgi:hypothetical protein